MAGTIVIDRIESDASYASSINVAGQITFSNTVNFGVFAGTAPVAGFYLPTTNNLAFTTASTERMRIDNAGNVGIGTSSPITRLDVNNAIFARPGTTAQASEVKAVASDYLSVPSFTNTGPKQFGSTASGTTVGLSNASLGLLEFINCSAGLIYTNGESPIVFGTLGTERMRIDSSGNVGIGTSSPSGRLSLLGDGTQPAMVIDGTTRDIGFPGNLQIGSWDGTTWTEHMRIDSGGDLLLNTTTNSLSAKLFVSGAIGAQQTFGPMFVSNENNTDNVGRGSFNFQRGGVLVGQIVTTNSTCAYNSVSDYRLKENITPITGALNKVAQLNPVTYKWKSNGLDGQGFIAHELQAVVPDCVTGEKDAVDAEGNPQYQGIDTSFLVATLTAAIKEQQALITALTARITALENN